MKRELLNTAIVVVLAVTANAQSPKWTGNLHAQPTSTLKTVDNTVKKQNGKVYTFKTFKHKELIVKAAYRDLMKKIENESYPKEKLAQEKKEFVCLMKGKIKNINA